MKLSTRTFALWTAVLVVLAGQAVYAQAPRSRTSRSRGYTSERPSRPVVSPYVDLARSPDPGFTYQRRVVPELEWRAATTQNREAVSQLRRRIEAGESGTPAIRGTGHRTGFMDVSHYYPSQRRR